jgi:hypothetical protein
MSPIAFWHTVRNTVGRMRQNNVIQRKQLVVKLCGVLLLFAFIAVELAPLIGNSAFAQMSDINHTIGSLDASCREISFSHDGNPFPLCPGPFPQGGNCTWWSWEQWHLLGYNLPLNWGNAADWISDAEGSGLPIGTTPRVGSIAVFPVDDGVWAYTSAGHVAFVTSVSPDGSTFNVTYQNYGDAVPMHIGLNYPVSVINETRYQDGHLRFIYFPTTINRQRFEHLPGVNGNDLASLMSSNSITSSSSTVNAEISNQLALGLPPESTDQEYNAHFTSSDVSDLLLYNRAKGSLSVLSFSDAQLSKNPYHLPSFVYNEVLANEQRQASPPVVNLGDKITPVNGWGSSLDIHIGDFAGNGQSDILLYNRVTGSIQILSLTPQLTIKTHVFLPGWGPGWELYVGNLDGNRSTIFMYNRLVNASPIITVTPTVAPAATTGTTPTVGVTPTTQPSPTPSPTPKPSPTPSPTPKPSPTPSPTPKPSPTPSPTPKPSPTPSPTPKPSPTPSPTPKPSPTPQSSQTPSPTPSLTPQPSPTPHRSPTPYPTVTITTGVTPTVNPDPSPTGTPSYGHHRHKKVPHKNSTLTPNTLLNPPGIAPGEPIDNDVSSMLSASLPSALASNVRILDFNQQFQIAHMQQYTLVDNSWEVYVGSFISPTHDALFLYDRILGEGRLLSFDSNLNVVNYQAMHNLDPNWEVYSGDFMGAGHSQLLLYDPSSDQGEIVALNSNLSVASQQSYYNWGTSTNLVLYVGHFGSPNESIMLYDPQNAQSTFIAFDKMLAVTQQDTVNSWNSDWEILIGAFIDRSRCLASNSCTAGDDILALNRQSGMMEQFAFSFGNQYQVVDSQSQGLVRGGETSTSTLTSVDTSSFSLLTVIHTDITNEELY